MVSGTIELPRQRHVARALTAQPHALLFIAVLTILRLATAAWLPLSFDESYFWLWSKHLALSYYDHPPMIALGIRLGTSIFGDTEFGVRAVSCALAIASSWAVWRSAAILLDGEDAGATAACFLSATLMFASQSMAAIPDALVLAASAFVLLCVAKLQSTGNERWWIGVGAALGFAFLSKYTAIFLAGGIAFWLVLEPRGRASLTTIWPWLALLIACICFAPNVVWNATHHWLSFKFQFGRVTAGKPSLRYLLEFFASQIALASPFVLLLAMNGFVIESTAQPGRAGIASDLVWPAFAYFLAHAIHDRVQGNWPSFTYPALAILAASALTALPPRGRIVSLSRALALPAASCILLVSYAQAWTGILPLGYGDPIARMTAVGIRPVADGISAVASRKSASAIVTSNYVVTGWLSFYLVPRRPIVQITDLNRWLQVPVATDKILNGPLLFVTQHPERELPNASRYFTSVKFDTVFVRSRNGVLIDRFYVYDLSKRRAAIVGRVANAPSS